MKEKEGQGAVKEGQGAVKAGRSVICLQVSCTGG